MNEVKIFLSGGMTNVDVEEQVKWRRMIKQAIKFGDYDYTKLPNFFDPTFYYGTHEKYQRNERELFEFYCNNIRTSDIVIVNFNDVNSIGTAMEIMLAKELRIPVVGICKDTSELHPWHKECCARICDDIKEAVDYVVEFYLK